MKSTALKIVTGLSFLGMFVAAYLVYQHFKIPGSSFCNVSDYVSCDVVNKSRYSEIFGIPVSILGFLAYVLIFFTSFGLVKGWKFEKISSIFSAKNVFHFLTLFSILSLAFSLYLTYVEFFVLYALCIFCLTQQTIILIISIILITVWSKNRKSSHLLA